ncbi:type I-E CRISPR-associated protein Cse1/CasA [Tepidiphilus sp. HLB4]
MYSLLDDPLIEVSTATGCESRTLPEVFAGLVAGEILEWRGLRAHQTDPWHVLLVQLGASVAAHRALDPHDLPPEPLFWRDALLELAQGEECAWHLVVEDPCKPAFLQHPVKRAPDVEGFQPKAMRPDELDILVTSKNHDVKAARASSDDIRLWLYALVVYQTMNGYLGKGNYGSFRMFGGFASRPVVGTVEDLRPSHRWREECAILCAMRPALVQSSLGYQDRGVVLTWLAPWSGEEHQFQLSDLEPYAIEAVRRLRLAPTASGFVALGSPTEKRQIGPRSLESGDVGDPWIPIKTQGGKKKERVALTLSGQGWTPELLCALIFERGFELTPLQKPRPGKGSLWFYGSVLVRGQGTTEGFHRFVLPIPSKVRGFLLQTETKRQLADLSQQLLGDAAAVGQSLHLALIALAEGGPEKTDLRDDTVSIWARRREEPFLNSWRQRFFDHLWSAADNPAEEVRQRWQESLIASAFETLHAAEQGLPLAHDRLYRAFVGAEEVLHRLLRKKGFSIFSSREATTA